MLGGYILRSDRAGRRRLDRRGPGDVPAGYGWLGKKAGSLSGGQQRLVEFARVPDARPGLVILDEPSMGLSPLVLKSVFDAVRMMNAQGKTILLVEQNARAGLGCPPTGWSGERPGPAGRLGSRGAASSGDRRPVPGRGGDRHVRKPSHCARERERGGGERGRRGDSRRGRGDRRERSRRARQRSPNGGASNGTASNGTAAR